MEGRCSNRCHSLQKNNGENLKRNQDKFPYISQEQLESMNFYFVFNTLLFGQWINISKE